MKKIVPQVQKRSVSFGPFCRCFLSFALRAVSWGTVHTQTGDPCGERFSFYHRLNYVVSGNPFLRIGGRPVPLSPGCLVYLPPNQILELDGSRPPVDLLFVNFEVGALDMLEEVRVFLRELFPEQYVHDPDQELLAVLQTIQEIGIRNPVGAGLEIQNLFEILIVRTARLSEPFSGLQDGPAPSGGTDILGKAMNYINENLGRDFRLRDMADALSISENYLYKLFVSKTGKSPAVFIRNLRMETAKQALANQSLPIKMIAAHLGYPDASHFSTVFKRTWGISPRAYRARLTNGLPPDGTA